MSLAGYDRRLQRLEQKSGSTEVDEWFEAVYEGGREYEAALAMVAFARALAGTDEAARLQRIASSPPDRPEQSVTRASPPPRRDHRPTWSRSVRPGPHDVLTWDEAMRVPWLDGTDDAAAPVAPDRPRGPWGGWGFNGPPSYARAGNETREDADYFENAGTRTPF